ncbi:hypothetical protein JM83_2347 [Gillisia sp. Hel_I_86]|uniref:carboxypeptidase-like regulatory domain-containing protein n=1 Tax=Gillisia sp. Hel_I_86 TaxID=1249981 RepID=UPI00119A8399|nr:carboxypeptidase-like regulatory domain-containing protein [Gillisia sp. Hel_I_86]TVZ27312.1 hypothetical protein JM83_2347 [Gillisia sp. Hel_I_86]
MKNYILFISFLFLTKNVVSQNYVLDLNNKKPIESVHILYNNNGLITNEDGYFEIPKEKNIDSIFLSHLSFKPKWIIFSDIKKNDTIYLQESPIILDEVVLKKFKVRDTILKAIYNIDKNYLNAPHNSFGFYRQSLKEDSKGIEMVEVDFISYIENKNSVYSTKITNARRTKNYSKIEFNTIGGVFTVIEKGDFVKQQSYFLNPNNVNNYSYIYEGQIKYQGLEIYKIRFFPKNKDDLKFIRKGELYIDTKSLAFVEINYSVDEAKLNTIMKLELKNAKINNRKPFFILKNLNNIIRYKLTDDNKWALSSIEAKSNKTGSFKDLSHTYTLNAKLVINHIKTNNVNPFKTNYNLSKDFSKAVRRFDNLDDWGNNFKLSLSNDEKRILNDIYEKKKNN